MKKTITKISYATLIRRLAITMLVLGIAGYIGLQLRGLVTGPRLIVTSPEPGGSSVRLITVSGTAKRAEELTINGNLVFLNQAEEFAFPLLLLPGYNVITVHATDRFGTSQERELVVIGPRRN